MKCLKMTKIPLLVNKKSRKRNGWNSSRREMKKNLLKKFPSRKTCKKRNLLRIYYKNLQLVKKNQILLKRNGRNTSRREMKRNLLKILKRKKERSRKTWRRVMKKLMKVFKKRKKKSNLKKRSGWSTSSRDKKKNKLTTLKSSSSIMMINLKSQKKENKFSELESLKRWTNCSLNSLLSMKPWRS